ncbi:hypothetical protein GGI11_008918, partial [Coemansia sp. RSA 2049]
MALFSSGNGIAESSSSSSSSSNGNGNGKQSAGRRRRRSIDGAKNARHLGESSDEETGADGRRRNRRNSNSGIGSGTDTGRTGFPAIEGYTVLSRIGEGAFSKVYRARQDATRRDVAIKAICRSGLSA